MIAIMKKADLARFALPDAPGVYLFKEGATVVYVGKATHLNDRVKSYFSKDIVAMRGGKVAAMVLAADTLAWIETGSVLEALILEANLIKKYQPTGNTIEKDNKSFNYVVITREQFPRVLVVRGRDLYSRWDMHTLRRTFGPYPDGSSLKEALKLVRKIFPFRDTCVPYDANSKNAKRPCFNRQIGLCPGVCDGTCSARSYASTIKNIELFFASSTNALHTKLQKDMRRAVKDERFEDAQRIQRQVHALAHIRDVSLIKRERAVSDGSGTSAAPFRIEAFDVAHHAGTHTVGVMVVSENGEMARHERRSFIIRTTTNNDLQSLEELLRRRFAHAEWTFPQLIVVDGGETHRAHAKKVCSSLRLDIPIVAVVKDDRHKARAILGDAACIETHSRDILAANAEAHTQAVRFHRKRRDTLPA